MCLAVISVHYVFCTHTSTAQAMAVWVCVNTFFLHPSIRMAWKRGYIILFKDTYPLLGIFLIEVFHTSTHKPQKKVEFATVEIYVILLDELLLSYLFDERHVV